MHILDVLHKAMERKRETDNTEEGAHGEKERRKKKGGRARGREQAKDRFPSEGFSLLFDSLLFCHFHKKRKSPKKESR